MRFYVENTAEYGRGTRTANSPAVRQNFALVLKALADPLGHYRPAEIPFVVREFCKAHGFITEDELRDGESMLNRFKRRPVTEQDLNKPLAEGRLALVVLLERGFLLGRNRRFNQNLTSEDLQCLKEEGKGLLRRQSWHLYAVIMLCSMGAALQGWDQTGSAAANLSWPQAFGLKFSVPITRQNTTNSTIDHDAWIVGIVNAMPYLVAPLGCLLSDPLNNWLGRLKTIFIAAFFCFVSVGGCAAATPPNWRQLLACRSLLGIGMGLKASTVPLLASESAPSLIRGSLVMQWQVNVALGIFLGSLANLALYQLLSPWRYQLGSAFIPAIPVMIAVWFVPESPVWFLRKGQVRRAYDTLRRLRTRPVIACRDLFVMYHANQLERQYMKLPRRDGTGIRYQWLFLRSYSRRMKELLTIRRNRRATLSSLVVMISQQLCGINIIAFYCATIYLGDNPENSDTKTPYAPNSLSEVLQALGVSVGFGFCNFVFSFPAIKTIDTFGRVSLLLATFPLMALSLLGLSMSFLVQDNHDHASTIVCILLFTIFYSPGQGPVPFTYAAEVFPATHRDVGMALSVSANLFSAGLLTCVYPAIQSAWGPSRAIGLFAGLNIVAFILIWLLVVETKQLPLEVLTERFSHSTWDLVRHRLHKVLPVPRSRSTNMIDDSEQHEPAPEMLVVSEMHEAQEPKTD